MLDWSAIDTVMLDMDGTLLDLHFDNHFWQQHLPQTYAQARGLSIQAAQEALAPQFRATEGTLDWYCLDYWRARLDLDLVALKREVAHLIAVHPHVVEFLQRVRARGIPLLLVTNAHHDSLALKMERTQLAGHFDAVICSHDLGLPKETPAFWRALQQAQGFDPATALLVDDSLPVLRAARLFGIAQLLAVQRPDSRQPPRSQQEFAGIHSFAEIMPDAAGALR